MYRIYDLEKIEKEYKDINNIDKKYVADKDAIYFCIMDKNILIGYAIVKQIENNTYELKRIFVRARFRYISYGKKLLTFIENYGREKNINRIVINEIVIPKFFTKCGFVEKKGFLELNNIQVQNSRIKEGKKVVISSIVQNILLAVLKIWGGIYGSSRALVSDGINSLADVGSSGAIYFGLYVSNKPADEEHPYGHEKVESIIGSMMGIFLILTAFELIKSSAILMYSGNFEKVPAKITMLWAGISMVVKYFMYKYKLKIGLKTDNQAIIADAKDSKSDAFSSFGVIVGIILSITISGIFDIIVSLIVGLLIFKEGVSIILENSNIILDTQDKDFIAEIENYILENTKVKNVHDIYMRKSGDKRFLTMDIRVPKDMTVYEAHDIAENISNSLKLDFENVVDVIIHIDYFVD